MKKNSILHTLSTGDEVIWQPDQRSISISFTQKRKVLSTSLLHGGYHEELTGIFNHNSCPDDGSHCKLRAATYQEHMKLIAQESGLDPDRTTGMGTAANMKNVAIVVKEYRKLVVTAIATAGVEGNGGRVGDPTSHFSPIEKMGNHKPGTINIMLILDADMAAGTMARALVTCTEAKTAALQELMVGSLYSTGLATGSGTDQSIVVANPQSPLYFEGAGKHSKIGELIGLSVKQAVQEALLKQNQLSPTKQHSMLRRFKRFGITEESLWQKYLSSTTQPLEKQEFLTYLYDFEKKSQIVTYASLYIHLLDQFLWNLLSAEEVLSAANPLLATIAETFDIVSPILKEWNLETSLQAWSELMFLCLIVEIHRGESLLST
ncbi:adenosylcobinamide amidohydrolase [Pelosinus sp. sgz500959]|uniref:adenosylcobinamide amidohydrolase n=1 Tax=Pelosinus sp. sgz500959 TaxID=3242472 RepID=UPI00366B98E2